MNTFHNSAEILLNSTLCLNGSLKTVWSVNFLKHWQSFHGTMYKIKGRAPDQSSIFAVKSVLLASRAWKGSTTRRQWSCWRRLRTASSWWCATLPRCWRRWRLVSKNWEQRGAGNSSNCSFSSSNSSKLHSKITCRRWEYSLSSLRPSGRAGPHTRACPTTSQGHQGSLSPGTGHREPPWGQEQAKARQGHGPWVGPAEQSPWPDRAGASSPGGDEESWAWGGWGSHGGGPWQGWLCLWGPPST